MGWDTSKLKYALIISLVECEGDRELEKIALHVIKQPKERLTVKLQNGFVNIYINNFDVKEAIDEVDWAISFWTEGRSAKPTTKKGKCAICEFKGVCESSLVK